MTLLEHYEIEREEGRKEGLEEGAFAILNQLVREGILTIEDASQRAGMTEDAFRKKMNDKT